MGIETYVAELKRMIRDYPDYNTLWQLPGGAEFADEEYAAALKYGLDRLNTAPPVGIQWQDLDQVPQPLRRAVYDYAVYYLLSMKVREISRNNVDYQSGDTAVDFSKIMMEYAQAAQMYEERAEQLATRYKVAINLEEGFGAIDSPFGSWAWW
jgi:hypothetical protein